VSVWALLTLRLEKLSDSLPSTLRSLLGATCRLLVAKLSRVSGVFFVESNCLHVQFDAAFHGMRGVPDRSSETARVENAAPPQHSPPALSSSCSSSAAQHLSAELSVRCSRPVT
jgi:hypothetical protein